MPDKMDRLSWPGDFQMDKLSQLKIPSIKRMINHHQCLSNKQNNIYTQKSMSLSPYVQ